MFSIQVFLPASLLVVGLIVPYPGRGPLSADEEVEYLRDVHPILAERCFACHFLNPTMRAWPLSVKIASTV